MSQWIRTHYALLGLLIIGNILFLIANIPFIDRVSRGPAGIDSPLIHNGYIDYFAYLSFIRESRDGSWQIPALYTTESSVPTMNWIFYIILGKISAISGIYPAAIYTIARIVGLQFFLCTIYLIVRLFLSPWSSTSTIIVSIFSTPLFIPPVLEYLSYSITQGFPKAWYLETPFMRIDQKPHYLWSAGLMFLALYQTLRYIRKPTITHLASLWIFTLISTLFHPTSALLICICLPVCWFISILFSKHYFTKHIKSGIYISVGVLGSILALLFVQYQSNIGFPWNAWLHYDVDFFNSIPNYSRDIVLINGIMGITACISIFLCYRKIHTFPFALLVLWTFLPFILLPCTDVLGIAKFRLSYLYNFIPVGILTSLGFQHISKKFGKNKRIIMILIFLCVFCYVSYHAWIQGYQDMVALNKTQPVTTEYIRTFEHLFTQDTTYPNVLTSAYTGIYLPAYIRSKVYIGNSAVTWEFDRKYWEVTAFFAGSYDTLTAKKFLQTNDITYVLVGPYERSAFDITTYGTILKKVYENTEVQLYKVIK
jgi:hypothetical protein